MKSNFPIAINIESNDVLFPNETVKEFFFVTQFVTDYIFQDKSVTTIKAELQDETYDDVVVKTK